MKSKHITTILDETPFKDLTAAQIGEINAHSETCSSCRTAFQAARLSSVLLQNRTTEVFEPSPFFESKILAALREKQIVAKPIAAFWGWWKASSMVIFPILLVVITLMALTIFAPQQQIQATIADDLAPEQIIFQGNDFNRELTTSQALQIIYEQNNSK
ncbi:MAG: hypothetical protein M3209_13440 [Acidobacteriota bacterium]|nr:hypothetical protein [Acidobacteriota bacterium]